MIKTKLNIKFLLIINFLSNFLMAQKPFYPIISWGYPTDTNHYPILDEEGFDDILNANFNGTLGWFKYNPDNITTPFDSAVSKGLHLINTQIYWPQAEGQYTVYEPDINSNHKYYPYPHFDTTDVVGRSLKIVSFPDHYVWSVDDDIDNAGYVVRGLKRPFNLEQRVIRPGHEDYDPLHFLADIRFRMEDTTGVGNFDSLLIVSVIRIRPTASDSVLQEKVILFHDVLNSGQVFNFNNYRIHFTLASSGNVNVLEYSDSLDYRIYWNGKGDLSIDNITTMDTIYHDFTQGLFDSSIENKINTYESYGANKTLLRWYLRDEPHRDMFEANKILNNYIQSHSSVGSFQSMPMKPNNLIPYMKEFVGRVNPQELVYHFYPFKVNTGTSASEINASFDQALALFDSVRQKANDEGTPLWLIPQMHQFYNNDGQVLRYPTNNEMKAQVYLNLCYAPAGLIYFIYTTKIGVHIDSLSSRSLNNGLTNFQSSNEAYLATEMTTNWSGSTGLVWFDPDFGTNGSWRKVETDPANNDTLWNEVQDINKEFKAISKTLVNMDFVRSFSSENVQIAGDNLITDITSNIFNPAYVQVGHMTHKDTGEDYFYLVNKRCLPNETQTVTVTFSTPGLKIEDMLASRMVEDSSYIKFTSLNSNVSTFNIMLQPGEGRLFRIDSNNPSRPTGFKVTGMPGENPLLSWKKSSDDDVVGYKIFRQLEGGNFEFVTTVYDTTKYKDIEITISGIPNNLFARYYIKAVDVFAQVSINSPIRRVMYTGGVEKSISQNIPLYYYLYQNYPNPFNPETTIKYDLPEQSQVKLTVIDLLGRKINTLKSKNEDAGYYSMKWHGRDESGEFLSSGVYIVHISARSLESGNLFSKSQKVVMLK